MKHQITRHRHEIKRRQLTVREKTHITPNMIRIVLAGSDLDSFVSLSPDNHVKLFLPSINAEPERRDYTPRYFDTAARTLTLDFAVHDAGPATQWAIEAKPGDVLEIGGPRGSTVVPHDFDWWLLIGDETALPAIGRRIEELPAGTPVISLVAVSAEVEQQTFQTTATHKPIWIHRPLAKADDPAPLIEALASTKLPAGDGFIWIAAEASVARAARDYLVSRRGHPLAWLKAAGYWKKGVADAHEKIES